jgi:autotransporter-associated beta strand protein
LGTGTLTFINGVLEDGTAGSPLPAGMAQVWAGTAAFAGTTAISTGTGSVTITSDSTVDVRVSTLTVAGNIAGAGGLTKIGSGSLMLSGTNTYAGATVVNTGTLVLNGAGALPAGSSVAIAAGATVIVQNGAQVSGFTGGGSLVIGPGSPIILGAGDASGTSSSVLVGPATITKVGSGIVTITGASTFTGKTSIQNGTLSVSSLNGFAGLSHTWSTFAGIAGVSNCADGPLGTNTFTTPIGIAFDLSGNLFVADNANNKIRQITSSGIVSTFAGAQTAGTTDATGINARFKNPYNFALDSSGNMYVSDSGNHSIRKITSSGVVTTYAGTPGTSGTTDGPLLSAKFNGPQGLAFDLSGNLLVVDSANNAIRKIIVSTGSVTSFAGTPGVTSGTLNGVGTAAQFKAPAGIVVDPSGNAFVTDYSSHTIRKITPEGVVSTYAGTPGTLGSANGYRTSATFNLPYEMTLDQDGNLFVTDNNHILRVITSAGSVSTIAGTTGVQGDNNAVGTAATFSIPRSPVFDASGNLYITNQGKNTIRKGVPIISTNLTQSSLGAPTSAASGAIDLGSLTSTGVLSVTGTAQTTNRILNLAGTTGGGVIDQSGTGALLLTGSVTATGAGAKTLTLQGSTAGTGEIYGRIWNNSVTNTTAVLKRGTGKWTIFSENTYSGGTTLTQGILALREARALGTGSLTITGGSLDAAAVVTLPALANIWGGSFTFIGSNALDMSAGSVSLSVTPIVTVNGGSITAGNISDGSAGYGISKDGPGTLVLSGTNTYSGATTVLAGTLILNGPNALPAGSALSIAVGATVILQNGAPIPSPSGGGVLAVSAGTPVTLGAGDTSANSFATFSGTSTLTKVGTGTVTLVNTSSYTGKTWVQNGALSVASVNLLSGASYTWSTLASGFSGDYGGIADPAGNFYVVDGYTIKKVTPAGAVTLFAGTAGTSGTSDGLGAAARFNLPKGLALDKSGTLYVADTGNYRVRKITQDGMVTTVAGNGTNASVDGSGTSASFSDPYQLAVDANGNLFVADRGTNKIRKVTPAGVVTTFAGSGTAGSANGIGTAASFNTFDSLAFDPDGNLYVADQVNNTIRKITPDAVVSTFAGTGVAGGQDGPKDSATFKSPWGVVSDPSGNLYVTEHDGHRVRVIRSNGTVSTLAGNGTGGIR